MTPATATVAIPELAGAKPSWVSRLSPRWQSVLAVLVGLVGGAVVLAVIEWWVTRRWAPCPIDGKPVRRGAAICPHCFSELNWS